MIVEEGKKESCLIKFDDKYVFTQGENEELLEMLINLFFQKYEEFL